MAQKYFNMIFPNCEIEWLSLCCVAALPSLQYILENAQIRLDAQMYD